jgi:UDP-N-acetylmuramate--alanine ligase
MMNLADIKYAYFLGIGGIGMSAIARYFNANGVTVMGYDKTETPLTQELVSEGIAVHYEDLGSDIESYHLQPENCLVVLTPAVPKNHGEWKWLAANGFNILKRSQVLGIITDAYQTIGVAGTHGKTTTSTLIAHLLKQSTVDCSAFLGGISGNYQTNLLLSTKTTPPSTQWMVVEADEFDRSFLTLHPQIAIITSSDADHLDIYGEHDELKKSFVAYAAQRKENGTLIVKKGLEIISDLSGPYTTYSAAEQADVYASNIRVNGSEYLFDLHVNGTRIADLELGIPGMHNVENAVAASAACLIAGITLGELAAGLASFKGVKRRFEYVVKHPKLTYIDDYAHHPEELRAIISSVIAMYPNKKIVGLFQPHLYSRTRDFAEGFAQSLSLIDDMLLLDIYPARELPIEGVTSQLILNQMHAKHKALTTKEKAIADLLNRNPDIVLTLGAGDIDTLVQPLQQAILNAIG